MKEVAQLSQRDRVAGWVSFDQSGRLGLGDNICRQYSDIIGLQNYRIR